MTNSRRDFLKTFVAASATLPLISSTNANTYEGKKLGVALVGLGSYATNNLAPAFINTQYCRLAGIVTGTPEKAKIWKEKYNIPDKNIYNYQNFDQIAHNPDIDVVYVVLPNGLHHEFTLRAAKAGKHVICEKPMAISVKECEEMIAACKAAKVTLSIGYRLHYEPFTNEVMRLAKDKDFGKVTFVESSFGFQLRDKKAWRMIPKLSGGGPMLDVGIYALNAARYATGEEPISVTAQAIKTRPDIYVDGIEETMFWQMKFPSGVISNHTTTYNSYVQRLYVGYENGNLEMSPAFDYGPLVGKTSKGEMKFPIVHHQTLMLDGICGDILNNRPMRTSGEEGLRDMKVMAAVFEAAKTGKEVKVI
ncbi:MAG: Gfo/Idh/MocA family oxidoreductase [Arcicella sp.]|nr:Gfo/Idh/MocA family oxidoreductase [Arcicella sp.]